VLWYICPSDSGLPSGCADVDGSAQTGEVNIILLCKSGLGTGLRTFGFDSFVEQNALYSADTKFVFPQKTCGSNNGCCRSRSSTSNVNVIVGGYVH
jgi:hypothetical protein